MPVQFLRTLAQTLNLSHAKVSESLRGSSRAKATTRQQIEAEATRLGCRHPAPLPHLGRFVMLTPMNLEAEIEELFTISHGDDTTRALALPALRTFRGCRRPRRLFARLAS